MPRSFGSPVVLAVAVLAGCGPKEGTSGGDDGSSGTTEGGASEESGEGLTSGGPGGGPGGDPGGEPEACHDVLPPQEPAPADDNMKCDVHGEYRGCLSETEGNGLQFCDLDGELGDWGPCLAEYVCIPNDYTVCWYCDSSFGTSVAYCELVGGVPDYPEDACATPLVLRFDERPVEFVASARRFRMTAQDRCASTDWPTAATPWLAIDLDRSGSIDGGHELFGSGTAIGPTWASDGFAALAVLDSDGDRQITPADARWGELLLWSDHDGDRRSGPWELEALGSRGVAAIDLGFVRAPGRCDRRGNCEIERASVRVRSGFAEVIDVRLACQ